MTGTQDGFFNGILVEILAGELATGNKIKETWQGVWPNADVKAVFLEKPFMTPIRRELENVRFLKLNDPHYWQAEYFDVIHNELLVCGFGKSLKDYNDL